MNKFNLAVIVAAVAAFGVTASAQAAAPQSLLTLKEQVGVQVAYEDNKLLDGEGVRLNLFAQPNLKVGKNKLRVGLTSFVGTETVTTTKTSIPATVINPIEPAEDVVPVALAEVEVDEDEVEEEVVVSGKTVTTSTKSNSKVQSIGAYAALPVNLTERFAVVPFVGVEHYRSDELKDLVGNVGVNGEFTINDRLGAFAGVRYDSEFGSDAKSDTSYNVGLTTRFW